MNERDNHKAEAALSERQSPESTEVVASLRGVDVLSAPHLKPRILRSIRTGEYEKPEIEIGLANLRPGDRILEMGTGAGIVGSVFAKNVKDVTVRSFEANPDLIEHIRMLYKHNNLDDAVSVSNTVLVVDNAAPDTVEFAVRGNFLGSKLASLGDEASSRKVRVPTRHYSAVTRDYPHNVLVMDIEGAELEFLADANLSGVDLVMLEMHPKVYGQAGQRQIANHMRRNGFVQDEATSIGQVASFKKPDRMAYKPDFSFIGNGRAPQTRYDLDPYAPLAGNIITVDNATLAQTPGSHGFRVPAAVFDENRHPVPEAVCWLSHRLSATTPRVPPRRNRVVRQPGTWLFGGRFSGHFGHFLSETLSRLWALDHLDRPIEGVLFFSDIRNPEEKAKAWFGGLQDILDLEINYKFCDSFFQVDKLIIPPQGNGISRLTVCSPEMRHFIKSRLKRDLDPMPHRRIYISRSGEFGQIGRGILGERLLERYLEAEGYLIFHPEEHSWKDQMRHYMSASHILALDGSAVHLVNYTGREDLSVGVIQRRPGNDARQLAHQGELFGIKNISALSHLGRLWSLSGIRRAGLSLFSELKLSSLCNELVAGGFISSEARWQDLDEASIGAELEQIANEQRQDLRPVLSAHDSLVEYPKCLLPDQPQVFFTN